MKLFSLGKCSSKLLFPFFLSFFELANFLILGELHINYLESYSHSFILFSFESIAELFCGFFELIAVYQQKEENENNKYIEHMSQFSIARGTVPFFANTKFKKKKLIII